MSKMQSASQAYDHKDPIISSVCKKVLTQYSKIPEDEIVAHVKAVREKAWQHVQYPCIGTYMFLDFGIGETLVYPEVLRRVKDGETLLDLGCCVGQDIRKLISDGAPAGSISGTDLSQEFIDLGYDLFQDRDTLKSKLTTGDFLADDKGGLHNGSYDMVYAGSFFHLFDWDGHIKVITSTIQLLKQKPGSLIFGRQTGSEAGKVHPHSAAFNGYTFSHNEETWRKLIELISTQTGVKLRTEVKSIPHHIWPESEGWRKLLFAIYID